MREGERRERVSEGDGARAGGRGMEEGEGEGGRGRKVGREGCKEGREPERWRGRGRGME